MFELPTGVGNAVARRATAFFGSGALRLGVSEGWIDYLLACAER